jgi:hypothetical protein
VLSVLTECILIPDVMFGQLVRKHTISDRGDRIGAFGAVVRDRPEGRASFSDSPNRPGSRSLLADNGELLWLAFCFLSSAAVGQTRYDRSAIRRVYG